LASFFVAFAAGAFFTLFFAAFAAGLAAAFFVAAFFVAAFFAEAFPGATFAPCSATAAAVSLVSVFSVVIFVRSPSAAIAAVITWITLLGSRSKAILQEIDHGDGRAMPSSLA
jgi:hypothetical protein